MMQTLNLYDTTGVNGYRVVRTRIARNHGNARTIGTEKELEKASKAVAKRVGRGRPPDRRFIVTIEPKVGLVCPCESDDIKVYKVRKRLIQCHPFGLLPGFVETKVHQFYCRHCHKLHYEHLPFLTEPKAKLTRALELKYRYVPLKDMHTIGIDEPYVFSREKMKDAVIFDSSIFIF